MYNRFKLLTSRIAGAAMATLLSAALLSANAVGVDTGILFENVAADPASGLTYQRARSASFAALQAAREASLIEPILPGSVPPPAATGGLPGVALFDHDGDGDLDLYVTNGPGAANSLFSSQLIESGQLSFIDRGPESGTGAAEQNSSGVCFGDLDQATLLIRLIDWPGRRPRADESARTLLEAGAEVDARRDAANGTPLAGAVCTEEPDVGRVLLELGADIYAPCGFQPGTVLDLVSYEAEDLRRRSEKEMKELIALFSQRCGRPLPHRAAVGRIAPGFLVRDVAAAVGFYTEKLGFRLVHSSPEKEPTFAIVRRGGADLHLGKCPSGTEPGQGHCHIMSDPVEDLYEEYRKAGVEIEQELALQPWGLKDFVVLDQDGNRLEIAGAVLGG